MTAVTSRGKPCTGPLRPGSHSPGPRTPDPGPRTPDPGPRTPLPTCGPGLGGPPRRFSRRIRALEPRPVPCFSPFVTGGTGGTPLGHSCNGSWETVVGGLLVPTDCYRWDWRDPIISGSNGLWESDLGTPHTQHNAAGKTPEAPCFCRVEPDPARTGPGPNRTRPEPGQTRPEPGQTRPEPGQPRTRTEPGQTRTRNKPQPQPQPSPNPAQPKPSPSPNPDRPGSYEPVPPRAACSFRGEIPRSLSRRIAASASATGDAGAPSLSITCRDGAPYSER